MGTLTTNYKLLKVDDDPNNVDDFVDVESQLDSNLLKVDDFGFRATEYKFFDNVPLSQLPLIGNNKGDKLTTNYDHSVKVWNGSSWQASKATEDLYTDVAALSSGIINSTGTQDAPLGYYVDNSATVFLRGIIMKTSLAIWTQGVVTTVCPAGSVPAPTALRTFVVMGGYSGGSGSRTAQWYQVIVNTDGSMSVTKFGATAQLAGNSENYVSLEGMSYVIS